MENTIRQSLTAALSPSFLAVENQSARHQGHAGDNGTGESHFEVVIVSPAFAGKSKIERHRMVFEVVNPLFKTSLHALSIKALAPGETPQGGV
jgi:BolA protein